jgi:diacylglycerol kinase (ATP)
VGLVDRPAQAAAHVKALFLVNERSGKRRAFDVRDVIRGAWNQPHEIVSCARKEDVDAIVDRAEAEGFEVVFAVGGDGTVHETAKRLIGRQIALGVLPLGSGNGFARHIGLPVDPAAALASCADGEIVPIDTALVNELPFLGIMGIGFDAVVAERFASSDVRGLETYVREGLRAFADFKAQPYEIVANGETLRTEALVVAIANSGQYGNNARIAPLASLRDGLLDVVVIGDTSVIHAAFLLARLFHGSIHQAAGVTTLRTAEVVIRRAAAGPGHLDGEAVTLPDELRVRVVPHSLHVLVPRAAVV